MTYTWIVTNLTGYPLFDGQADVVTTAFYTVVADDGKGHVAEYQNAEAIPYSPDVPFIPYADLTNDIVVGWIKAQLGEDRVNSIYACLDAQIAAEINPPITPQVFPLPWVTPVPPAPDTSSPTA